MAASMVLLPVVTVVFLLCCCWTPVEAETHTDCGLAQTAFSFCVSYVAGIDEEIDPKCCVGARSVQELIPTSIGERVMCECLKQELVSAGAVDEGRTLSLALICGVSTNYLPTSLEFECNGLS
ncbi:Lipid transfer protein [Zostera marina]|uniref:Lipid transfer protein n=1 Tax=Zostera marina TaxID=29655 RepID=A0A0K9PTL5_ZOSMR|nr:Lipid transfer protein [Zostera marina]